LVTLDHLRSNLPHWNIHCCSRTFTSQWKSLALYFS
jgi:hypothetical protein